MGSAEWELVDEKRNVSVQRGTSNVPDDGRYHLLVDGVIVLSTKVEALALAEYEEIREQRRAPAKELLRRELGDAEFLSMRRSGWADKSRRDSQKGGRGIGRR